MWQCSSLSNCVMRYMSAEPSVCVFSSSQADTSEDINHNSLPDMLSDSLRTNIKACNYYDIFKLNTTLNDSSHFFIHLNISSFQSYFDKLYDFLLELTHPPSIIFISETRINKEPLININLPRYTFLHSPSPSVVGGVGVYFSNQLTFAINNLFQLHVQGCEDLWFNVTFPNSKSQYIFAVIYCHPHNNHTPFFNALDETLEILNRKESKVIIMGDININISSFKTL